MARLVATVGIDDLCRVCPSVRSFFTMIARLSGVLVAVGLLLCGGRGEGATVLWANDFQSDTGNIYINPPILRSLVNDPAGTAGNQVLRIADVGGGTGTDTQWGEVRPSPQHGISIGGATAGLDTYTFTLNYYVPANSVAAAGDILRLYIRWGTDPVINPSSGASNGESASVNLGTVAKDTWHTLTYTTTINSNATYLFPIISIADLPSFGGSGTILYLDNVSFTVTPEPGRVLLLMLGLGTLVCRRSRSGRGSRSRSRSRSAMPQVC
jgi:hypothetical protein